MKTMIDSEEAEWKPHFLLITKFIGVKLSPSKLEQYLDLMKLFRSRRMEGDELIRSVQILFEEDECLSKMFNTLMGEEIRELKNNETRKPVAAVEQGAERDRNRERSKSKNDETEEGETREEHRRRVRGRCEIGGEEADIPIKKRRKYTLGTTGPTLGPHGFKSEINQNCSSRGSPIRNSCSSFRDSNPTQASEMLQSWLSTVPSIDS